MKRKWRASGRPKSYREPLTAFHLLMYMVKIWELWLEKREWVVATGPGFSVEQKSLPRIRSGVRGRRPGWKISSECSQNGFRSRPF